MATRKIAILIFMLISFSHAKAEEGSTTLNLNGKSEINANEEAKKVAGLVEEAKQDQNRTSENSQNEISQEAKAERASRQIEKTENGFQFNRSRVHER